MPPIPFILSGLTINGISLGPGESQLTFHVTATPPPKPDPLIFGAATVGNEPVYPKTAPFLGPWPRRMGHTFDAFDALTSPVMAELERQVRSPRFLPWPWAMPYQPDPRRRDHIDPWDGIVRLPDTRPSTTTAMPPWLESAFINESAFTKGGAAKPASKPRRRRERVCVITEKTLGPDDHIVIHGRPGGKRFRILEILPSTET